MISFVRWPFERRARRRPDDGVPAVSGTLHRLSRSSLKFRTAQRARVRYRVDSGWVSAKNISRWETSARPKSPDLAA